jgi:hypothetical protein
MLLELAPDGELRRVIGADREGRDRFEADATGPIGIEQLGRQLAEAQALLDMALGGAEAARDVLDDGTGVDQRAHRHEFVGRMHRGADRVLGKRRLDRVFGLLDLAGDLVIGVDRALGCELLQDPEAAAAGMYLIDAVAVGGMDDQVRRMPLARMLASSAASSAAVGGVVRTLAGDRTS